MDASALPQDDLGGFDFLGDIDPVLWSDPGEPGSSSAINVGSVEPPALRCVDETHPSGCTRCTPCPSPDMAHKYELIGEDSKVRESSAQHLSRSERHLPQKNGLKRLRSLLTRTREWRSSDARDAAAAALQSVAPRAAEALRTRHSSLMSKELAFAVLGYWNYRSDVWQKRGNRVVHAQEKGAAASPPPPPAETKESAATALWMMLSTELRPLSLKATHMLAGADACALAKRDEAAARMYVGELPMVRRLTAAVGQATMPVLAALLAEARAAEEQCESEALLLQPGAQPVAAAAPAPLRVESVLSSGVAFFCSPERASSFQLHAGASPAVSVWSAEWVESQRTSWLLCSKLADTLAQSRAHSPALYATAAAMVCEFLSAHFAAVAGALNQRISWVAAAATALGLPSGAEAGAPPPLSPSSYESLLPQIAREFAAFFYSPTLGMSGLSSERADTTECAA